jgi:O-antigen/teichoic acid export membrane protein
MSAGLSRNRRLKFSVVSSLSGKGVSIVTQLLALPLAVAALGLERYGAYAMLMATFLWASTATVIVGSALSLRIVGAHANDDEALEARLFSTAFFFTCGIALVLSVSLYILICTINISSAIGIKIADYESDLRKSALSMACIVPLNVIFSLADAAQSGYQRQYLTNILYAASNIFIIALLINVKQHPSIYGLTLAIFLPPMAARLLNLAFLLCVNRHLRPKWKHTDKNILLDLLAIGSGFFLMQIGSFAYQQFPLFFVGRYVDLAGAAYFSAMMQVISISGSLLIIFTQPLLPAIRDATIRGDVAWTRNAYWFTVARLVPYIIVASIVILIAGSSIVSQLLRHPIELDTAIRGFWALFFLLVAWEHLGYIFLTGIGSMWIATVLYIGGAVVMLIVMVTLSSGLSLASVFFAMCLGPILLTTIAYPTIFRSKMSRLMMKASA